MFFFAYGQYFRLYENEIQYNLIPLKTILSYIAGISKYNLNEWFFNLFGNVLAFTPMGFLLPIIFNKIRSFKRVTAVTFLISSVLEMTQYWLKLGITDVDDVILNTVGGLLGYLLLELSQKVLIQKMPGKDN
jgi:glycopeptide antibiotics resistance protein